MRQRGTSGLNGNSSSLNKNRSIHNNSALKSTKDSVDYTNDDFSRNDKFNSPQA